MRQALHRPLRHFLIWCLALLLPLQGLAAGAGLHCVAMAAVGVADTAIDSAAHPCHGMADGAAASTDHTAYEASPEPPAPALADELPASGHTCSACAACCMAAALPSHSRWAATDVMAQAMPVLPLPHCAGVTSAGLDRPPKAFIA